MIVGDVVHTEARLPTSRRVGGFYQDIEDVKRAAAFLNFNVLVGPPASQGFFMVPQTKPKESDPE